MMMDITPRANPALHLVPMPIASGLRRAVCQECGAHAAVTAGGASVGGACSVCGSSRLEVLDERLPPPRISRR